MSLDRLTDRQRAVVQHLRQGLPNKEIAKELGISVETVKTHMKVAMAHAGVGSRLALALAVERAEAQ